MAEFKYEITERIAVLSQSANGWQRQLNMVSWNDRAPKYDIRDWSPDNTKMGKGISLSAEELLQLKGILEELEIEGERPRAPKLALLICTQPPSTHRRPRHLTRHAASANQGSRGISPPNWIHLYPGTPAQHSRCLCLI